MTHNLAVMLTLAASTILATACGAQSTEQTTEAAAQATADSAVELSDSGTRSGSVVETFDAASYTYVQVDTGSEVFWAAGPLSEVKVGQQVTIPAGDPMQNFHSDTLDRDFPLIFFVPAILDAGQVQASTEMRSSHAGIGAVSADPAVDLSAISVPENGITIGTLYATKDALAGKEIIIRAKVVKVNLGIMGRNWIHVQDGSGDPAKGTNDLTITTEEVASIGDTVVVSGSLTLDKDFGAGYRYQVIIEDAAVTVE